MERMDTTEDDDFQAKSKAFLAWLQQRGATISEKIELADLRSQQAGRGVVATADLEEDEELFSIPRSSILTLETTSISEAGQRTVREGLADPWLELIFGMVVECLKGGDSAWRPYFDILPTTFDTPMFWNESELSHLEGSAVLHKIGKESADQMFQGQILPLLGKVSSSLDIKTRPTNDEMLSLCHRMASTIMAYAFDLETPNSANEQDGWEQDSDDEEAAENAILPKGMIPLADMLNADAARNNAKLFYQDDHVVMKTLCAVRAGEQLYNDFGNLPRADLLRRYGYVTPNYAPYDVVEVSADLIREHATAQLKLPEKELAAKWSYADSQGALDDGYDISRADSQDGQFPEELCVLLNLLVTNKAEFDNLQKKEKLPKAELSGEAKKLLRTVVVHRYAMYPPRDDVTARHEGQVNEHRRTMALQVLDGEKQVLREAVDAVTDTIASKKRAADTLEEEAAALQNPVKR